MCTRRRHTLFPFDAAGRYGEFIKSRATTNRWEQSCSERNPLAWLAEWRKVKLEVAAASGAKTKIHRLAFFQAAVSDYLGKHWRILFAGTTRRNRSVFSPAVTRENWSTNHSNETLCGVGHRKRSTARPVSMKSMNFSNLRIAGFELRYRGYLILSTLSGIPQICENDIFQTKECSEITLEKLKNIIIRRYTRLLQL